ncbi:MAG TPA: hypothetical protein VIN03_02425 [Roseateles sp.]
MDKPEKSQRRVSPKRSPRARASMTASQLHAYFLARETLRRLASAPLSRGVEVPAATTEPRAS